MTNQEAPILFEERVCPGDSAHRIAFATLNQPSTLNGLSLEMATQLTERLLQWQDNPQIAVVVILGAGDRALCAGGDLHALYRAMVECREAGQTNPLENDYARTFFATEYRLDYLIHTYRRPVLCWGNGIVMGGGIGIMAGASHRVVTERSRLAMPEISVGLFPDVGGSWLLPRSPGKSGLFLALTGAPLNAADAVFAGLADHIVAQDARDTVFDALTGRRWSDDPGVNAGLLSALLRELASPREPGPLERHFDRVLDICAIPDLDATLAAIAGLDGDPDPWLAKAAGTTRTGSPGSLRLAWELQHRTRLLSLADVFRTEYTVALHCNVHGDFQEGIRTLLVEKGASPQWSPTSATEASTTWADRFFIEPWDPGEHPLADLGMPLPVAAVGA